MATIRNDPLRGVSTRKTPQTQPIPGANQVANNAGGFVYALDSWKQLERFFILGTAAGTYYATQDKLTKENADLLITLIQKDGQRVVRTILDIDKGNRAPKMNPLIFGLAACFGFGDLATRRAAEDAVQKVCRIGTHIFLFVGYVKQFKSLNGRILQRTLSRWYNEKPADHVAFQMVKYRQREGWSHRDLVNLAHPKPIDVRHEQLFKWAIDYQYGNDVTLPENDEFIAAFTEVQATTNQQRVVELITFHNLPWEALPDQWMNNPVVWEALIDDLGYTALLRQLTRLTKIGLLTDLSSALSNVCAMLTDKDNLRMGRIHPITILNAMLTYGERRGQTTDFVPVRRVVDALDAAFYQAFEYVEPTGSRIYLAIDCSGSMEWPTSRIADSSLFAREGAAAVAMAVAKTEANWCAYGFTTSPTTVPVSASMALNDVVMRMRSMGSGGTDCAQPMIHAQKAHIPVDAFYILTDSETYAGAIHPKQALESYKQATGIDAKLVVFGMTSSGFTIADPMAPETMLDVVGLDSSAIAIASRFVREEI